MNRGLFIFRCASSAEYLARHAALIPPATRELILFMRECGICSSWAWHGNSPEAVEIARMLLRISADDPLPQPRPQRRAA
jgi:hypothetical protein